MYFTIYYEDRVWGIKTNISEAFENYLLGTKMTDNVDIGFCNDCTRKERCKKCENKMNCDKAQDICLLCNNKYLCNYKAGKNDLSYAYEGLQSYLESILTIVPQKSDKEK